jgi:carbamoyl-phosphate synthase large subunit
VVDLIKGERIQLIINTPHGVEPWFDEKAIRRAAVSARIPTITSLSAARAAREGIAAFTARGSQSLRTATTARGEKTAISNWQLIN